MKFAIICFNVCCGRAFELCLTLLQSYFKLLGILFKITFLNTSFCSGISEAWLQAWVSSSLFHLVNQHAVNHATTSPSLLRVHNCQVLFLARKHDSPAEAHLSFKKKKKIAVIWADSRPLREEGLSTISFRVHFLGRLPHKY